MAEIIPYIICHPGPPLLCFQHPWLSLGVSTVKTNRDRDCFSMTPRDICFWKCQFLNYWESVLIFYDRYFCNKDFFSLFFSQIGTFETNQHLPRLLGRLLIVDISKILKHVMSFWINIKITRWYVPNFKQTSRSQLISQSWLRLVGLFFGLDCLDKGIDLNRFCLNYREQTFEAGNSFSNVKI